MRYFSRDYIKVRFDQLKIDISHAKWAIIFIIAYFVVLRKYFYSTCPIVIVTGFPCPACGMTRAGFQLLNFEFREAFRIHPFIYVVIILILCFAINRYVLLKKSPEWLKWVSAIMIIAMVVFYIWRMIMWFPGEAPMSYYSGNLLSRISKLLKTLGL